MTPNKWYKNPNDKVIAGVLSGLVDYLGWHIDLSLVRI
ncbi:PspC domain-containing protein, partial [Weissella soli]